MNGFAFRSFRDTKARELRIKCATQVFTVVSWNAVPGRGSLMRRAEKYAEEKSRCVRRASEKG